MDKQDPVADVEQKIVLAEKPKEQPVPSKDEKATVPPLSVASSAIDLPSDGQTQAGTSNIGGNHNAAYPHNFYASQAQPFYYQGSGYENPPHEWDAYPPYVSVEGLEVGPTVVYNEDPSMMFHNGYGYDPYAHYSPITTPVPAAVSGDGQLYSPQQFSFSAPYYQQSVPPGMPYLSSPTPISQEWFRSSEGNGSFPSSAASPQPAAGVSGAFGQSNFPVASGMMSLHQKPFYGLGAPTDSYGRGFSHGGIFPQANNYVGSFPSFGLNGRSSISIEKGRRRGRGNALICSCNGSLDFLNEQSRGPRATRPKKQSEVDSKDEKPSTAVGRELYNRPDFVTEYKNARFFIIKSYSEDNVHKSIKYGVWASTTNGNKKLDSAYREAMEKEEHYPIFLLFSVNASAQFCGVAEMIGPVDFAKSVDYWQQDKWTGQFPVKWHIVKDVPNNLFRHIILENNDNKPVTNSRDTQEVKLEQGLEMLKILKNYDDDVSILDDFDFYEEREKALLENKARLHQQQPASSSTVVEPKKPLTVPAHLVGHSTKRFAQVMRLGEAKTVSPLAEKVSGGDSSIPVKPVEVKESGL
ncbi:YTH domain-containing protein ECT4-like isoform X2 [Phragmites australis]|uniref:YTH domain-containing protein ECT4-like isoform X2 n=1 Tax=Phragmites australis TaxID=29695 RepID=UPI002D79FCA8|nr:YTH domain-containing protein ECT4-like isoform X2 [Phragmites australis]